MAVWRTIYDRNGEALVYRGETAVLELDLQQPDDEGGWEAQSLVDRVFVQRVIDGAGAVLHSVLGVHTGGLVQFTIAGTVTDDLDVGSYRHELAEVLDNGRDVFTVQPFVVAEAADPALSLPSAGIGVAGAAQFTIQQGPRGRVVVRYVGAPGAPGEDGSQRVDIPLSAVGTYLGDELLGTFGLSQNVAFLAGSSQAVCKVAPTADTAWRFFRNGVLTFSVAFPAGQLVGSLSAVPATLLAGRWDVYAAAVADASFADAFVFLVGDRTA